MCTVILSISVSRRQSVFTAQSNTLQHRCPSVPVGLQLSYQFQFLAVSLFPAHSHTLPHNCLSVPVGVQLSYQFQFHAVSLYSQPNLTPYRTAVRQCLSVYSYLINFSFTPSVSIHSPFLHLTVQLSVGACRCTVILSISFSRRQSVFTAQSKALPHSRPSVPVGVQLSYQFHFHAVSLYSQPNLKPYRTAVRQCLSVYSYSVWKRWQTVAFDARLTD